MGLFTFFEDLYFGCQAASDSAKTAYHCADLKRFETGGIEGIKSGFKEFNDRMGESRVTRPTPIIDAVLDNVDPVSFMKKPRVNFFQSKSSSVNDSDTKQKSEDKKSESGPNWSSDFNSTSDSGTSNKEKTRAERTRVRTEKTCQECMEYTPDKFRELVTKTVAALKENFDNRGIKLNDNKIEEIIDKLTVIDKRLTCRFIMDSTERFSLAACRVLSSDYIMSDKEFETTWNRTKLNDEYKLTIKSLYFNNPKFRATYNFGIVVMYAFLNKMQKYYDFGNSFVTSMTKDFPTKEQVLDRYEKSYKLPKESAQILYNIHGFHWMYKGKQKSCGVSDELLKLFRETNFKGDPVEKVFMSIKEKLMNDNIKLNSAGADTLLKIIKEYPYDTSVDFKDFKATSALVDILNNGDNYNIGENNYKKILIKYYNLTEDEVRPVINLIKKVKYGIKAMNRMYINAIMIKMIRSNHDSELVDMNSVYSAIAYTRPDLSTRNIQILASFYFQVVGKNDANEIPSVMNELKDIVDQIKEDTPLAVYNILLNEGLDENDLKDLEEELNSDPEDQAQEEAGSVETPEPEEPRVNPDIKESVENGTAPTSKPGQKPGSKGSSSSNGGSKKASSKKTTGGGTKSSKSSSINQDDESNVFSGGSEE